jgi:hypothetical protein
VAVLYDCYRILDPTPKTFNFIADVIILSKDYSDGNQLRNKCFHIS